MDEEKKKLNEAIAVMRDYCKNVTCKDCELDKAGFCGVYLCKKCTSCGSQHAKIER